MLSGLGVSANDCAAAAENKEGLPRASASFDLPYRVELWDENRERIERIVARAHSETLARAIFNAAAEEFPGRHLSLWRGRERLAEKE